jgi:hypothetical protein
LLSGRGRPKPRQNLLNRRRIKFRNQRIEIKRLDILGRGI